MPLYPIDCECGSIEGWSRRKLPPDATEVECFECDRVVPIGTLKASQLARVTGFGAPRTVPGLSGEFHSFGEIERAAAAVGGYVESDEEKKARRLEAKKASVEYAESIGYGSRQEYLEARKARGTQMVAEAREKMIERKREKYGSAFVQEEIGGVDSYKWRTGLQSDSRPTE